MTAEIAVINKSAIALAADSALTIGKDRVWKNANKLFSLSPINDVGIMIYGSGDFCGIPWEIIIKSYRQEKRTRFDSVSELQNDFVKYLNEFDIVNDDLEELNIYSLFISVIDSCFDGFATIQLRLEQRKHIKANIKKLRDSYDDKEGIEIDATFERFVAEYGATIDVFAKEQFGRVPTKEICRLIRKVCYEAFIKEVPSCYETGIVFAGYGKRELLPHVTSIYCDGRSSFGLRWWNYYKANLNDSKSPGASVMPFAQTDIFYLFVEGITSKFIEFIGGIFYRLLKRRTNSIIDTYVPEQDRLVEKSIQDKMNFDGTKEFLRDFSVFRQETAIQPMMKVLRSLPKEEMAAMAEALVELTSLKRKMDSRLESVGGPVDVAVISKGDGFVWIKRKHYFKSDLNADFEIRRRMRHAWEERNE